MTKNGYIVNAISGKCLNVKGVGVKRCGQNIDIWKCLPNKKDGESDIIWNSLFYHVNIFPGIYYSQLIGNILSFMTDP